MKHHTLLSCVGLSAVLVAVSCSIYGQTGQRREPRVSPEELSDVRTGSADEPGPVWNGYDPFHQPFNTTDYYGSGDVDGDGDMTESDVTLAQRIVDGLAAPTSRADVDGSGTVDSTDVARLQDAIAGATLAAWWNKLNTPEERTQWLKRCLAVDMTDEHPYLYEWWQCHSFSVQAFIHGSGFGRDLSRTLYDGGRTVFNLPIYPVGISRTGYGHSINAILVGDDPLKFDDWHFFEPQDDSDVHPGGWNMPYETTVDIWVPTYIWAEGCNNVTIIGFDITSSGWSLRSYDPNLVLARTPQTNLDADNLPYCGVPRLVEIGSGKILFERHRDDLSRTTDICVAPLGDVDLHTGVPLTMQSTFSRLLDVRKGRNGMVHVLWKGKPQYDPGVFYGTLDPQTDTIYNATRLSSRSLMPICGRVVEGNSGDLHVFWRELDAGIYWMHRSAGDWQELKHLVVDSSMYWFFPGEPNSMFSSLDACASVDSSVVLVWMDGDGWERHPGNPITMMRYQNSWSPASIIDSSGHFSGIALAGSSEVEPSLVYCQTDSARRLLFRQYHAGAWSIPITIDSLKDFSSPHLSRASDGALLVAWQESVGSSYAPVWSRFRNGSWEAPHSLAVPAGFSAWYPTVAEMDNGAIAVAWSARSDTRVTIQYSVIGPTDVLHDHIDVPGRVALLQNYPNPFNPSTTIRYELPHPAHVELRVYSTLGQEVATLVDENKRAGSYAVQFDGSGLASGVYLYRLLAGGSVTTKKLVLLR